MNIGILAAPSVLLSHADICKLRYQTTSFTALHGLTQSMKPPGIPIYNSSNFKNLNFVYHCTCLFFLKINMLLLNAVRRNQVLLTLKNSFKDILIICLFTNHGNV